MGSRAWSAALALAAALLTACAPSSADNCREALGILRDAGIDPRNWTWNEADPGTAEGRRKAQALAEVGALERDEKDWDLRLRLRVVANAARLYLDAVKDPAVVFSEPRLDQTRGEIIGFALGELLDWCEERGYVD